MDNCDYVIDGDHFFSNGTQAREWYQKQYHRLLEENAKLEQECAALRKQLISACNELMEIKR